jgi:adenylate kinase family enzyme
MPSFPWLPLDTAVNESVRSNKVLSEGNHYQILDTKDGNKTILLINDDAPWLSKIGKGKSQKDMLAAASIISPYHFNDEDYWVYITDKKTKPVTIESLIGPVGTTSEKISYLGNVLSEMSGLFPDSVFDTALLLENEKLCIATEFDKKNSSLSNKKNLATRLLVGAVQDAGLSIEVIRKLNPDLSISQIRDFFSSLGIEDQNISLALENTEINNPSQFSLPGRPELEQFFRDNIIDYFHRYKEYQRMGIKPPNGILLYGPPGTGKTYSVKKLADFLGWKVFDIDVGSVGSPYIHQTSKLIKEFFDTAAESAPSIVLMEEIDALTGSRSGSMHDHKIEEIAQLLRLIETASTQGVLVIGTTNRFESMDEAIIRRGRFDHVIELGFPSTIEIQSAVENLLKNKPVAENLNLQEFSEKLSGYPMSDIAWAINEAARYAVKNNKDYIDRDCLMQAANSVLSNPRA